jgi:hypothetical protein
MLAARDACVVLDVLIEDDLVADFERCTRESPSRNDFDRLDVALEIVKH